MTETFQLGLPPSLGADAAADVAKGKGTKDDKGKIDLTYFDPWFKAEVCQVMGFGGTKYARGNWQLDLEPNRILAALERHTDEIKKGIVFDDESGYRHSAHIGCNAMFINFYERHNRPVKTEHDKK